MTEADAETDGRWLTFAELAAARGISRASASKLVRRHKWRRQTDNRGAVRILVPPDAFVRPADNVPLSPSGGPWSSPMGSPPVSPVDMLRGFNALADAVGVLREQLAAAEARADRAEQGRDAERAMQAQLADAHAALQAAEAADARAERAEQDKARAEAGREAERARADALQAAAVASQERLGETLAQLATAVADAKAAHERAWASGEQLAEAERRAAAEQARADRAASAAAHERQDFLDTENRTRREVDTLRERLDATQAQLAARQEVVDAAEAIRQADDARRALGRWARLRRAWRAE